MAGTRIDYPALIADLRAAAALLEKANAAYRRDGGRWSPEELRYEADYLTSHADDPEEV